MNVSRSSIFSASCAAALAILAAVSTNSQLQAFEVTSQTQTQAAWSGFGSSFNPQWYGVTKRVDWQPPSSSSGVILWAGGGGITFGPPASPKPIRLVSSTRQQSYTAQSSVFSVIAETGNTSTSKEAGVYGSNVAQYAQILNLQNLELVKARTVSEQNSTLTDNSISASGRVSTSATLHAQLAGQGESIAYSQSLLSANYYVTERMPFTLSGSLAGAGALDIEFSIVDQTSGKSIFQVKPTIANVGRSWNFDLSGSLIPGSYQIKVDAHTSASSKTSLQSAGGSGEYKLAFSAIVPPVRGDLNGDAEVDAADLGFWRSNFGKNASGDLNADGRTDGADFLVWQRSRGASPAAAAVSATSIPEPASLSLLVCGLATFALTRRR
ncbi:hypothetical protein [Lacipirellula parvula]|uniref:PEP-CTERM protein-sorting domain-containing protein n=1 Tax=Lacipirellula parvula TaxID=2650471 RepID=A0A5K7XG25_9BACT|nr:hypothetical protein [Lacipirellula parvula]BBO35007.1 hypothetical protein PLANPX_4619 [Lacipirellula parvula]